MLPVTEQTMKRVQQSFWPLSRAVALSLSLSLCSLCVCVCMYGRQQQLSHYELDRRIC